MAQFREFLEDKGLPPNDERTGILLPVVWPRQERLFRHVAPPSCAKTRPF